MTTAMLQPPELESGRLPDHTQLPDRDDEMLNAHEPPQSNLLTESIRPRLLKLHPNGRFFIGPSVGIYFSLTTPVLAGCRAPDWFCVLDVEPMLDGKHRRSYVMWYEPVKPFLVAEYVSGDGRDEHDATPMTGKFWIYQNAISAAYYVIFDPERRNLEVFCLVTGRYQPVEANAANRFPIPQLGIELGMWEGLYREQTLCWLRAWDSVTGKLILVSEELLEFGEERVREVETSLQETRDRLTDESKRAENAEKLATSEKQRADRVLALARKLRLGQATAEDLAELERLEEMSTAANAQPNRQSVEDAK